MGASIGSPKSIRLLATILAVWLCGTAGAWAGSGGEDLAGLNSHLLGLCRAVGLSPCPQLPTITQALLEIAGLDNAPPEEVRADRAPETMTINAGAINAGNPWMQSTPSLSNPLPTLSFLSPLAFIGAQNGQGSATPTQLYDRNATAFIYAVATGSSVQPDTLNLFYDDLNGTNNRFTKGSNIAVMSVPLTILNKNAERPVMITVQVVAACSGNETCLTANAIGDFSGNGNLQTRNAADLGINFQAVFSPSLVSSQPHLIFGLQVPLLVTHATDAPYFAPLPYKLSPDTPTAFVTDLSGVKFSGSPIGIAPAAAPLCTSATCPAPTTPPTPPAPANFAFCANLPDNVTPGAGVVPAVATFFAISTDGETLLSAPLNPDPRFPIKCPF